MHYAKRGCHGDGPRELSSVGGQVVRQLKADPASGSNKFAGCVSAGLHLFPIRTFSPSETANQHEEAGGSPQQGHHLLLPQQLQRRSQRQGQEEEEIQEEVQVQVQIQIKVQEQTFSSQCLQEGAPGQVRPPKISEGSWGQNDGSPLEVLVDQSEVLMDPSKVLLLCSIHLRF